MITRRRIVIAIALVLALMAIVVVFVAIPQLRQLEEFGTAESVKGYWAGLQNFQKEHGRYPRDEAEMAAYFQVTAGTAPVRYVPPHDDNADEPVLWWKEKTRSGVMVGITESGEIVKR